MTAAIALSACDLEQPFANAGAQAPQTAATVPTPSATSTEIGGAMDVINARIPATQPGSDTAQVEMTLANVSTKRPDTLRAASSPAARAVVFIISGQAVPRLVVPVAGAPRITTGPPYPDRILLTGLRHQLRAGQTVPISLVFARAGQATLQVPVIPPLP